MSAVFTVEGFGEFPLDMLRYDCCYPDKPSDAEAMSTTPFSGRRKVTLVSNWPSAPTQGRWQSFSWPVVLDNT